MKNKTEAARDWEEVYIYIAGIDSTKSKVFAQNQSRVQI